MLFSALGASMAFAVPMNTSEISFYQAENTLLSVADNVEEAILQFALAKRSEQQWGKRRNSRVSEYIITYCEYCSYLIRFGTAMEPEDDQTKRFEALKSSPVPDSIKSYKLPLPSSPDGKAY